MRLWMKTDASVLLYQPGHKIRKEMRKWITRYLKSKRLKRRNSTGLINALIPLIESANLNLSISHMTNTDQSFFRSRIGYLRKQEITMNQIRLKSSKRSIV